MVFGLDTPQIDTFLANPYGKFAVIVVLWFIGALILTWISRNVVAKIVKKTKTKIDDMVLQKGSSPFAWLVFFIGIRGSLPILALQPGALQLSINLIDTVVIILAIYLILIFINIGIDMWGKRIVKQTKSNADDALLGMFHRSVNVLGIALGMAMIFQSWGIEVGPLLASLGIVGIAVAFALQNTLGNIFGGVSMILDKTYRVGDWVEIGNINGKVFDVGIRATKIRTWDNEIITIPNGRAADSEIKNYTLPNKMVRLNIDFGVAYGSKIEQVQKVVLNALKKNIENLVDEEFHKPHVYFKEFGASSLNFIARFWVQDYTEKYLTLQKARTEIYKALEKANINIPFPQMDLHVKEMPKQARKK